jgi:hypothetical protein
LATAQLHCRLHGVLGFDFGARALFYESELASLRVHGAFPVVVQRRGQYEVRVGDSATAPTVDAREALRAWLALAQAMSPLDNRYELSGI